MLGEVRGAVAVEIGIFRSPGSKTVDVAVHHAEVSRDQHRVVDFEIGRTMLTGLRNVFSGDMLAALLHMPGDFQQGFELRGDRERWTDHT